ncbi:FAD-dependent monooxygenase [Kribbella qitaiheensis]|uniref:FAD-dependent monooxygenase n=1 Tax=Kribbella qitaiheensis TaxID=1544730 RepID=UPI0019D68004|nr:FAD-dependent monooxygenase [Kribbella qitaiheensis]
MGLGEAVHEARTRTSQLILYRDGKRPISVDLDKLTAGISSQHVEILRGELTQLLYDATREGVEYVFGDSIATLDDDGDGVNVTFEHGEPRRFDLVIGADGMHSMVRRLAFGPEESMRRPLGGYLAVYSMPDELLLRNRMLLHLKVGRSASTYGVRQTGQARACFLFRRAEELQYDYRDTEQQKRIIADEFADYGWEVPRLLKHLDAADDFYFDSITQITLDSWQRGRIGLVGDAGYCPGPAVGGGTSLAAITAYVLAGELAAARSDLPSGLRNYEQKIRQLVDRSRAIGPTVMKTIIPGNAFAVRAVPIGFAILPHLPAWLQRRVWSSNGVGKALGSLSLPDYADLVVTSPAPFRPRGG